MTLQVLPPADGIALLTVAIQQEVDVVVARQRARHIAELLGFARQDQVRVATAVSEVARNAFQYGRGGRVEFSVDLRSRPQMLWIEVRDKGPGIADVSRVMAAGYESSTGMGIGLAGSKRLMDEFAIQSAPGAGTTVVLGKMLPTTQIWERSAIANLSLALTQKLATTGDEMERQNRDLLLMLDTLRGREAELERRREELVRLNLELEETNRGVVALYAELDEKAVALRKADEMKSRFLRHVSHEFRTPVNSVLALTRLLLQRTDGALTAEQEKQVQYIRQAADHLAEMVNDLLDLARVESGKTEVHAAQVDLGQFLGAVRALMRPLVTNPDVALVFEEPGTGVSLYTDEAKLGQIVRNLISNALKFTQQGEVRVSADVMPEANLLRVRVRDTGIGIRPEDHERIFQEFAQIDSPLQRQLKGTGLGLPLSRKLASLLGGTLQVESAPGMGSTFTLELPARLSDGEEDEAAHVSKTILVVDDDPTARYLVRQLFRGTKYELVEATGTEASERARFEKPALILLDLMMPDRSGFEVLHDLKTHEETRSVPVVIHTSRPVSEADLARFGGQQSAVLPKSAEGRLPALLEMRRILADEALFASEPEFQ